MSSNSSGNRRILVGVDGSPNSAKAIDWAVNFAHAGDTVVLLSSWSPVVVPAEMAMTYTYDDASAKGVLEGEVSRVTASAKERGVVLSSLFENNDPRVSLLNTEADFIVVGSRGHGGVFGLLLGSVADYVSRHAKVPVVIVPAPK
jgi:nucleotide-binding universal stress UspA family protein